MSYQAAWRWCSVCQALYFGGNGNGVCPAGGQHNPSGSGNYQLLVGLDKSAALPAHHQGGWRWCEGCQNLHYANYDNAAFGGVCSQRHSAHALSGGFYAIAHGDGINEGQAGWRWCSKCQSLWFSGTGSVGVCSAGGGHIQDGSGHYQLKHL